MNTSLSRTIIASLIAAAVMTISVTAQVYDESKYPDWAGQWRRPPGVNNQWEPTRPRGHEGAPLTAEYQAIFEANLKDQDEGGQGTDPTYQCIPDGMPRAMNVIFPMEIIIEPKTTYIYISHHVPPHLHRWTGFSGEFPHRLHGLLDRPLDRYRRRRPL
jgi:hypothetical protein